MAAEAIASAAGIYSRARLAGYTSNLSRRFDSSRLSRVLSDTIPYGLSCLIARKMLETPWFVRHFVLDRWFLHAQQPALVQSA
jgi:hypothetical protein